MVIDVKELDGEVGAILNALPHVYWYIGGVHPNGEMSEIIVGYQPDAEIPIYECASVMFEKLDNGGWQVVDIDDEFSDIANNEKFATLLDALRHLAMCWPKE